MASIEAKVRQYVVDNLLFGRTEIGLSGDTSFLETGIIDSTGVLELVQFLEETFHLKVEDEDLIPANLDSVNALTRFVENKHDDSARSRS